MMRRAFEFLVHVCVLFIACILMGALQAACIRSAVQYHKCLAWMDAAFCVYFQILKHNVLANYSVVETFR